MELGGKLEANANDKVEVTGCRWYYGMPQWFLLQVARVIFFFFLANSWEEVEKTAILWQWPKL